nr:hypothetical protein [Thiocapsa sp.]
MSYFKTGTYAAFRRTRETPKMAERSTWQALVLSTNGSELGVSIEIQVHPLVEVFEARHSIAAALDDFELIVEPFHKATGPAADEIIRDLLEAGLERAEETIETRELAVGDAAHPTAQFTFALTFRQATVVDGGERLAGFVRFFEFRGVGEEAIEEATLIGIQVGATMPQDPMRVLELIKGRFGERATQPLELALAQGFESLAIQASDMKAVRADEDAFAEHGLRGPDEALVKVRADNLDRAP